MAKNLNTESPSSAVVSELVEAASACIAPPNSTPPANDALATRPATVRREFAIPPELDELLGYELVPAMRRATGLPVNRSTVLRALLGTLAEAWLAAGRRFPEQGLATSDPDVAAAMLLENLLESTRPSPGPRELE